MRGTSDLSRGYFFYADLKEFMIALLCEQVHIILLAFGHCAKELYAWKDSRFFFYENMNVRSVYRNRTIRSNYTT